MVWTSTSDSPECASISGGWHGSKLAADPGSWRVPMPGEVRDDLLRAAAAAGSAGINADPHQPRPQVSARTRSLVAELYRRLAGDPGVVVLAGFPVTDEPELTESACLLLGKLLGQPIGQMLDGSLLARIEDTGSEATGPDAPRPEAQASPTARPEAQASPIPRLALGAPELVLPITLPFHVDRCTDLVGLLCIRPARAGGLSRLVSCKAIHNLLLARYPDLLAALYQPVPVHVHEMWSPGGNLPPRWCEVPTFSQVDGHFAAYYSRRLVEGGQQFTDAPRLAEQVVAALDAVDELTAEPGLPLEMAMQPGDLQLINNLFVLHARTAYQGENPGQGRLLLRMHLAFAGSPALPAGYAAVFGASAAGTYRGGLRRTRETQRWLGTPLRVGGAV